MQLRLIAAGSAILLASCLAPAANAPSAVTSLAPPRAVSSPIEGAHRGVTLKKFLDDLRASYGALGAIALLRDDRQTWWASSGVADINGTAIGPMSRFRIGSITKLIVALLVVDAVERGELMLDDVVTEVLPNAIREEPKVTVRQLLDHTSGIFDEGNEGDPVTDIGNLPPTVRDEAKRLYARYLAGDRVIVPAEILVALAETHDRYFAAGTDIHYSNINYQLAAMVLERVTGNTVDELLRDRIVGPLELARTTIAPPDLTSPEMRGYAIGEDGSLLDLTDDLATFGNGGNGGIVSTADELITVVQGIAAGRLVAEPLLTEMTTPNFSNYGLGVATYSLPCGDFIGHGGSVNGTISIALSSPDGSEGLVVAMNLSTDADPLPELAAQILCAR